MTRPMGLTASALLITICVALSPALAVPANATPSSSGNVLFGWASIALQLLLVYFYWNAHNWARIVVLIGSAWFLLGIIEMSLLPVPAWIHQAMWGRPLFFVRAAGDSLLAVYLLCYLNSTGVRTWFKRGATLGRNEPISN